MRPVLFSAVAAAVFALAISAFAAPNAADTYAADAVEAADIAADAATATDIAATAANDAINAADAAAYSSTRPAETPHLAFVREYIREVEENDEISVRNKREIAASNSNTEKLMTTILAGERTILALQTDEEQLKYIRLKGDFHDLPALIIHAYERKIDVTQKLMLMAAAVMSDPKPEINYGKLTAAAPKLTASVEFIDKALFEATGLVVLTLVDEKPDKNGHLSHLVITRAERQQLIDDLTSHFGKKINQSGHGYIVASASLIKGLLLDHKCADDPW